MALDLFEKLNPAQAKAVRHVAGPLRVIAGAGTGKTRVLVTRTVYLISEVGIKPNRILCITFTNKAAGEMKTRVANLLGNYANSTYIMTYHAFCLRVLKEDANALGWAKNFTVVDEEERESLVKQVYNQEGLEKERASVKSTIAYISGCKNARISPEQALLSDGRHFSNGVRAKAYQAYALAQKRLNVLDFDDLILMVNALFANHEDVRNKWKKRFDYVMVDEFQDTNDIQYEITRYLCEDHQQLFVVGDPDQTIYTWRGSNIDLILNLDNDFPELTTILLEENYRSTGQIIAQSNALIKKNKIRIDKNLYTHRDGGPRVDHFQGLSQADEANWVAGQIADLLAKNVPKDEIAVLYRSNFVSREVEQKLIQKGIAYTIYGGTRFFNRKEVKDMLAYIRTVVSQDELAIRRIINVPSRKISEESVNTLAAFAKDRAISLWEALERAGETSLATAAKNAVARFLAMIGEIRVRMTEDFADLVETIMELTDYKKTFQDERLAAREENIKELMNSLFEFQQNNPEGKIEDYLNEIALYVSQDNLASKDTVSLMTVHAAKGLEFEHVFVVGLAENIFPSGTAMAEGADKIEEERRIAYVAMTRAKDRLYLTNPSGFSFVTNARNVPSRFLYDLNPNALNEVQREFASLGPNDGAVYDSSQALDLEDHYVAERRQFSAGETIVHATFGAGVVLNVFGDMVEVAFAHPFGVKTLMSNHKSIVRKLN